MNKERYLLLYYYSLPGKYWNLIIKIPRLEYAGNSVNGPDEKYWDMSLFLVQFFYRVYICDAPLIIINSESL